MNIAENKLVDADWAAIAVVIFGVTAFSVSQGLTYPLISLILAERGVAAGIIGLNGAVFAIGVGASTLMIGPITAEAAVTALSRMKPNLRSTLMWVL